MVLYILKVRSKYKNWYTQLINFQIKIKVNIFYICSNLKKARLFFCKFEYIQE